MEVFGWNILLSANLLFLSYQIKNASLINDYRALGISLSLELFFEKYNGYFFMSAFWWTYTGLKQMRIIYLLYFISFFPSFFFCYTMGPIIYFMNGKSLQNILSTSSKKSWKDFEKLMKCLCTFLGLVEYLSTEISTSKQKKFNLVTFVDTPGKTFFFLVFSDFS